MNKDARPDINDTACEHGLDEVRARHDRAHSQSKANGGDDSRGKHGTAEGAPAPLFDPWERYIAPEFPLHVLPPVVQGYVTSQSVVIGCDRSALAMAALTAFSGALDHRFAVKMMRNGNWWEHPRLWTLLVGDSSRKKTPIINDVTRPIERHQNDLRRSYEAQLRDYEAARLSQGRKRRKARATAALCRLGHHDGKARRNSLAQ